MFAYCNNNPVLLVDEEGNWPSVSSIFAAVAAVAAVVAVCAVAAPVLCCALGVTTVAATTTAIASTATTVAAAAAVTSVIANKAEQTTKSYTIYTLSDPATNEVVYVGRTSNYRSRMIAHSLNPARKGLTPNVLHEGLNYYQARALEQAYIVYYSTLDKSNKANNQINGVSSSRKDYPAIMRNGFGFSEAIDSLITNELLVALE